MATIDGKALAQLKVFVQACQMNPGILHEPKLSFFKEYLISLGAKVSNLITPCTFTFTSKIWNISPIMSNNHI